MFISQVCRAQAGLRWPWQPRGCGLRPVPWKPTEGGEKEAPLMLCVLRIRKCLEEVQNRPENPDSEVTSRRASKQDRTVVQGKPDQRQGRIWKTLSKPAALRTLS